MHLPLPLGPTGRPRLLVVVDDETILCALHRLFAESGFDVACAATADEACSLCRTQDFSAAIIDSQLSGHSEREVLTVLRSFGARRLPPCCVVLTANGAPALEDAALRLGAIAVFQKPPPLEIVADTIDCALALRARADLQK